jgi:polysaccharide biosynthesis/export protein
MKPIAIFVCLASVPLAGCVYLPTAGPTASEVIDQGFQNDQIRYDVVDINSGVVTTLLAQPVESFRTRFGRYGKPPPPKIGIGDTVSVSIWEAAGGGLFGASAVAGVSTGSRNVTIPDQVVGADGGISVPFAGRVPVAGRTTVEVQREIEQRLSQKAIEPQVIITITKSVTYAATVSGEVIAGARVPLSVNGDRMLDLIALAGGAKSPVYSTLVRLSRNGVTVTMPMERLVSDPAEDIYAQPGDVVTLVQEPQTYSVLGATGTNAQIMFNAERITLAEAIAKAGGLLDLRSDPTGVFLFRFEPPAVVAGLNAPQLETGPDRSSPVVYRLDMGDANAYFLAQRFPIEDKDVIYVANAKLNELQKFFTLLNTITGPVITGIVVKGSVNSSP